MLKLLIVLGLTALAYAAEEQDARYYGGVYRGGYIGGYRYGRDAEADPRYHGYRGGYVTGYRYGREAEGDQEARWGNRWGREAEGDQEARWGNRWGRDAEGDKEARWGHRWGRDAEGDQEARYRLYSGFSGYRYGRDAEKDSKWIVRYPYYGGYYGHRVYGKRAEAEKDGKLILVHRPLLTYPIMRTHFLYGRDAEKDEKFLYTGIYNPWFYRG